MRKAMLLPLAAATLFSLAACGQKAQNEAAEANEAMAGDSDTMGEAVSDVNAAENAAFGAAEASYSGNAADIADGNEIIE